MGNYKVKCQIDDRRYDIGDDDNDDDDDDVSLAC